MCGIVGAIAHRLIAPVLLEGLRRLEYRGYDSAGIAVINENGDINRARSLGKIKELETLLAKEPVDGKAGIAHTRWATHGVPAERNAHPHLSRDSVAVVHNGIIENHDKLRTSLEKHGYEFTSETDTEVIAHQIQYFMEQGASMVEAVRKTAEILEGAYAIGVISTREPNTLVGARHGSPLVVGLGIGENFIASDIFALVDETKRFIFLEDGDIAVLNADQIVVYDKSGEPIERTINETKLSSNAVERGAYRHFMQKEIHEQPVAVEKCLDGRIHSGRLLLEAAFGLDAKQAFAKIKAVQIVACGTSYHAGMIARYWIEDLAGIPCNVSWI